MALVGAASAVVHQLRYAVGYGSGAGHALAAHPHAYMSAALPGVLTAVLIALAAFAMQAAGMRRTADSAPVRFTTLWALCALALAVIFTTQETLEGAGAIAGGGWIGLALAVPAGLLVALALRGARAAESVRSLTVELVRVCWPAPRADGIPAQLHARLIPLLLRVRGPPRALLV